MDLTTCRKKKAAVEELYDNCVDDFVIAMGERDYYRDVLMEIYAATQKNGGSGWINDLAGIALGYK